MTAIHELDRTPNSYALHQLAGTADAEAIAAPIALTPQDRQRLKPRHDVFHDIHGKVLNGDRRQLLWDFSRACP